MTDFDLVLFIQLGIRPYRKEHTMTEPMSITTMLVGAVVSGAVAATGQVAGAAIKDAYGAFKALIVRKLGAQADVENAIQQVEAKPKSEARRGMLAEELDAASAAQDAEIVAAAKELLRLLDEEGIQTGISYQATVSGSGAAAQDHSTAAGAGGVAMSGGRVGGDVVTGGRHTVFDQRHQQVQNQTNIAGDRKDGGTEDE
jgi:hypothetical protein